MRIVGPNRPISGGPAGSVRSAGGGAVFRLETPAEPAPNGAAVPTATIAGVDALLMLQGEDTPQERRRRAVARGRGALDLLDAVKLALLSGDSPLTALRSLERAAADLAEASGDPGLDRVLGEIDVRVAVELAKHAKSGTGG